MCQNPESHSPYCDQKEAKVRILNHCAWWVCSASASHAGTLAEILLLSVSILLQCFDSHFSFNGERIDLKMIEIDTIAEIDEVYEL